MSDGGWLLWLLGMVVVVVVQLMAWLDCRTLLLDLVKSLRLNTDSPFETGTPPVSFEVSEHEAALLEQEALQESESRASNMTSRLQASGRASRRINSTGPFG
jgi:hypothetical protein